MTVPYNQTEKRGLVTGVRKAMADKPKYLVDPKVYALAEIFLGEQSHTDDDVWELAHVIQRSIEDWMEGRDDD